MKILYSAGNRRSAAYQLYDFICNCKDHEIKIASYIKSGFLMNHIDWTLDAIPLKNNLYYKSSGPYITLLKEIEYYDPDLIICDIEPIVCNIAKQYNIPLWYCSPLHMIDGLSFLPTVYKHLIDVERCRVRLLPIADRIFVYAPFGDLLNGPSLKNGYEWVAPYHSNITCAGEEKTVYISDTSRTHVLNKLLRSIMGVDINFCNNYNAYVKALSSSGWVFNIGNTREISAAIYGGIKQMCLAPNTQDVEAVLNGLMCSLLEIGNNLGQIEFMKEFAIDKLEGSMNNNSIISNFSLKENKSKFLHEKIDEIRIEG